jgi:hypothetical protein
MAAAAILVGGLLRLSELTRSGVTALYQRRSAIVQSLIDRYLSNDGVPDMAVEPALTTARSFMAITTCRNSHEVSPLDICKKIISLGILICRNRDQVQIRPQDFGRVSMRRAAVFQRNVTVSNTGATRTATTSSEAYRIDLLSRRVCSRSERERI